jgi:hypothetical protein
MKNPSEFRIAPNIWKPLLCSFLFLRLGTPDLVADAITIDFEGDGRSPFVGPTEHQYRKVANMGIRGSKALVASNYPVASLNGEGAKPFPAGTFTKGGKLIVGTFFKFSAFPRPEPGKPPGETLQALRIGLTAGTGKRFNGMPAACLQFTGKEGEAMLRVQSDGPQSEGFPVKSQRWYYFEAHFTRPAKGGDNPKASKVRYELFLKEATDEGLLGADVATLDATLDNPVGKSIWHDPKTMDGPVFAGFKGDYAIGRGAAAVIDNFFFGLP